MLVMGHVLIWWGVPIRMASVFRLLSRRKLQLIHAFISSRQVDRVDDGDAEVTVVTGLQVVAGLRVGRSIFRYNCVS